MSFPKDENGYWERCVAFHGHTCNGLLTGYRAALYAIELLDIHFSADEEIVCIAENDACSIDAIQAVLGCTMGKGNLLFHLTGKHAYSFYDRKSGKSVRLMLKPAPASLLRDARFGYYTACPAEEMFDAMPTRIALPDEAELFRSVPCSVCGENCAEHMMRIQDGKPVCRDCFQGNDAHFQI